MWQRLDKNLYREALYLKRLMLLDHLTLSVAESCTGGEISSVLTRVPGISRVLKGAVVVYSPDYKESVVGVPHSITVSHGTVSYEMALQLAQNIQKLSGTDIGLSVVCVLGPFPDEKGNDVGLTYIGVVFREGAVVHKFDVSRTNRVAMKKIVALKALRILRGVIDR